MELPFNRQAENAVLVACMTNEKILANAVILTPEDFYSEKYAAVFGEIKNLFLAGKKVNSVSVIRALQKSGNLGEVGGADFIQYLIKNTFTAVGVEGYVEEIKQHSQRRKMIQTAGILMATAQDLTVDPAEALNMAQDKLNGISYDSTGGQIVSLKSLMAQRLDFHGDKQEVTPGIHTGFYDFDSLTSGLFPGELIILAARPSMGKSAFAFQIAKNAAASGSDTAVFNLEMANDSVADRYFCQYGKVNSWALRKRKVQDEDVSKMAKVAGEIYQMPGDVSLIEKSNLTVAEIRGFCYQLKARGNLKLVVIDYLQLINSGSRNENRNQELDNMTRQLKALAKDLKVAVVVLSQLSRAVESRSNKRPVLSDLRDSGGIEANADVVTFIYRDEYYLPDTKKPGIAEIIVAKNRNGPLGTIELGFNKQYIQFFNKASRGA